MKTNLFLFFFIFLPVSLFAQIPDENLKAFYPFRGNANDESGNGFDGVVKGASLTNDRFGNSENAYLFNGSSDYIEVDDFSAIDNEDELAISLWARANQNTGNCMLMLFPDDNSDRCVTCAQFQGSIYWDYGNIFANGRMHINSIPFDTLWHHYVYSISFEKDIKQVYMDGKLLKSDTGNIGSGIVDKQRDLWIGGGTDENPGNIRFNGAIDDIRIYNKFLSQKEVSFLNFESPCKIEIFDTTNVIVYDTLVINDTLTVYDTITVQNISLVYDTIAVTDTLVIDFVLTDLGPDETYSIKVYPVPTENILNIHLNDFFIANGYVIKIMNSSGVTRYESIVNESDLKINLASLGPKGIYFMHLIDASEKLLVVKKLILK